MGLYLLHLHLHGLFRAQQLELGRDPDTGGQTTYVLELAQSLAACAEIDRVEVVTRLIQDRRISPDYARACEPLAGGLSIHRLPFGPRRYLRKELLWPFLDELVELLTARLLAQDRRPDWIHAHYADAGYVGAQLQRRLGIPLVFTAHSLGREKRRRLLAAGQEARQVEQKFCLARRIEAEEMALVHSQLVVTSTGQELAEQYARYGNFRPSRAAVIPPGVDAKLFFPPSASQGQWPGQADTACGINALMRPFLREPRRPPVLAICRPDHRKNIAALVEAFGCSELLRQRHNLVLLLGCRQDTRQLERPQREVFQQLFELVDRFDLYGAVAYPKQHLRHQIPAIYRWAARLGGVFVNSALTEPFGLTLLEAGACGLPVVATDDGGPREILQQCGHGLLVDVSDLGALGQMIELSLADRGRWSGWRAAGIAAVSSHYSWAAHVQQYLSSATAATSAWRISSGRGLAAIHPGVVAIGVGHPVAQLVVPEQPARQLRRVQPGAGHGREQLPHLQRREIGLHVIPGDLQQSG
jgi:sucrose-phosphate synthase